MKLKTPMRNPENSPAAVCAGNFAKKCSVRLSRIRRPTENSRLDVIGVVRNAVRSRKAMTHAGTASRIVLKARYRRALEGLRPGAHLWVLGWLHEADRGVLRAAPRKTFADAAERGVFATRSPDRPNPIALSACRLLAMRGTTLWVDRLDMIDGTPVVDLKPYAPGIDSIPSARSRDFTDKYRSASDDFLRGTLRRIVRNHCGRLGKEGRAAAELVLRWIRAARRAPSARAPGRGTLETNLGPEGADALHALFSLRPSSRAVRFSRAQGRGPFFLRVGKIRLTLQGKNEAARIRHDSTRMS